MSMRKPSEDRKAEILVATLKLAFEVGPTHVSTGMIANRLGLTQPAIYKHFPRKEEIWADITEILCSAIDANTRRGSYADQPALERLRALILGHLRIVSEFPTLPEIMTTRDPSGTLTKTRQRIQTAMGEFREALVRCFDDIRAGGTLRAGLRTEDAMMLLFGIIQSLVLRLIVTRDPTALIQEGERLFDLQMMLFLNESTNT